MVLSKDRPLKEGSIPPGDSGASRFSESFKRTWQNRTSSLIIRWRILEMVDNDKDGIEEYTVWKFRYKALRHFFTVSLMNGEWAEKSVLSVGGTFGALASVAVSYVVPDELFKFRPEEKSEDKFKRFFTVWVSCCRGVKVVLKDN